MILIKKNKKNNRPLKQLFFVFVRKNYLYLPPIFTSKVSLIMSKSLENLLQAMSGVTFGKSPNGTIFAERERERERERD
jgi:hypothetical protein